MKDGICPKCGGTHILANLCMIDRGDNNGEHVGTTLGVMRSPDGWLFRDIDQSPLRAWVCEDCGFTEFYALNPRTAKSSVDKDRQKEQPYRVSKESQ